MVQLIPKEKPSKKNIAIAIQTNYYAGMKAKDIADLLKISKQRVNYWLHNEIKEKRKRRTKLTIMEK